MRWLLRKPSEDDKDSGYKTPRTLNLSFLSLWLLSFSSFYYNIKVCSWFPSFASLHQHSLSWKEPFTGHQPLVLSKPLFQHSIEDFKTHFFTSLSYRLSHLSSCHSQTLGFLPLIGSTILHHINSLSEQSVCIHQSSQSQI